MGSEKIRRAGVALTLLWALTAVAQTQANKANQHPPATQQQGCSVAETAAGSGSGGAQPATAQPTQPGVGQESKPSLGPHRALNTQEKFNVFLRHTYAPYIFIAAAFDAGIAQASDDWASYGQGAEGYGKRYGASLANNESGAFFGRFLFPTIFHQDPRYLRAGTGGTGHRVGHAISRVLVTRSDSGRSVFNVSQVLAAFASSSLANTYYPREERSAGDTMVRAGSNLLNVAGVNVLREFWPEIKSKFKKHEPERVKRLEEKLPIEKVERVMGDRTPDCR